MKQKILIVDDEELARRRIRVTLEKQSDHEWEVLEAVDGVDALEKIPSFDPDVLFLDIQMPELTGFDVLRHAGPLRAKVVFQTAYDEFAVRAFEVNACDYLLKPFTDDRLRSALDRALGAGASGAVVAPKLDAHFQAQRSFQDRFVIKIGAKRKMLTETDIDYFVSVEHVTHAVAHGVEYAYDQSLTQLQERLDPARYARIHRNCLVKLTAIASFTGGPEATVLLKSGARLKASREGARLLKRLLDF